MGLVLRSLQLDDDLLGLLAYQMVADENVTKTGTYHETGSGASGSTYYASGSSSYLGVVSSGDVNREKTQADAWSESLVDNSDYNYEDQITYADDGSVSKRVQETGGGGGGAWDYAANGTYWALAEAGDVTAGDGWSETSGLLI